MTINVINQSFEMYFKHYRGLQKDNTMFKRIYLREICENSVRRLFVNLKEKGIQNVPKTNL